MIKIRKFEEKTWILNQVFSEYFFSSIEEYVENIIKSSPQSDKDLRELFKKVARADADGFSLFTFSVSGLSSMIDDLRSASQKFPIEVSFGVYLQSSFNPSKKEVRVSFVSLDAWDYISKEYNYSLSFKENIVNILPSHQQKLFLYDASYLKVKQSFVHELTHWLDFALLHDFFPEVKTFFSKRNQNDRALINTLYFETNAQINSIINTKDEIPGYNDLTLLDIVTMLPPLNAIYRSLSLRDGDYLKDWLKYLAKRLVREGGQTRKLGEKREKISIIF